MKPLLSIIIPCYNSEKTLGETLASVYNQNFENWEAIIVNDGSKDNLESVAQYWAEKDKRFRYFEKKNGGLGSARNYGIRKAKGEFILPLDSDNMVRPNFFGNALKIFRTDEKIGVIYGDAQYFGERDTVWQVGNYNKFRLSHSNYIDACAIIRQSLFHELGGYDEDLPYQGHEDWEFWLKIITADYRFYYLKEITFDYRVSGSSMIKSFDQEMLSSNVEYIKRKHWKLYESLQIELMRENGAMRNALNERLIDKIKRKLHL
jgi:glycosyltransferase involved in cell wall biosynthesis